MKPLIIACTEGFERLVTLLLENNADINIQDHVRYIHNAVMWYGL